jgi:hypothetical protein
MLSTLIAVVVAALPGPAPDPAPPALERQARIRGAHARARAWHRWAHRRPWRFRFSRLDRGWQSWARAVSWCESRNQRYAVSPGGHLSYFQWLPSTWAAARAPFPRTPVSVFAAGWHNQAVVAVAWAQRTSTSQWTCSPW